jgi:hypothetical protein
LAAKLQTTVLNIESRQYTTKQAASILNSTTLPCPMNETITAKRLKQIINKLNYVDVIQHFTLRSAPESSEYYYGDEEQLVEIEPYVVCDGVTVDGFNQYITSHEDLPIHTRFLDLDIIGRLLILEYPDLKVRAAAVKKIQGWILQGMGRNGSYVWTNDCIS